MRKDICADKMETAFDSVLEKIQVKRKFYFWSGGSATLVVIQPEHRSTATGPFFGMSAAKSGGIVEISFTIRMSCILPKQGPCGFDGSSALLQNGGTVRWRSVLVVLLTMIVGREGLRRSPLLVLK